MNKRPLILREDGCYDVPLTRGLTAIIDAEDAEIVSQHNWVAVPRHYGGFYAHTKVRLSGSKNWVTLRLHTLLIYGIGLHGYDKQVDHADHDGLNNRRSNLRATSNGLNMANRKTWGAIAFKGVFIDSGKYRASICKDKIVTYLGHFPTPEEAARAYDAAAIEYHGEFAALNFPDEKETL